MPNLEVIHIDGVGTITRATQAFVKSNVAQCEADGICFYCGTKMTHRGTREATCYDCELDLFGD